MLTNRGKKKKTSRAVKSGGASDPAKANLVAPPKVAATAAAKPNGVISPPAVATVDASFFIPLASPLGERLAAIVKLNPAIEHSPIKESADSECVCGRKHETQKETQA